LEIRDSHLFYNIYSGETLKEIGTHFGIGESAVSQRSRRLALKLGRDNKLRRKIKGIEGRLELSRVYRLLPKVVFKPGFNQKIKRPIKK